MTLSSCHFQSLQRVKLVASLAAQRGEINRLRTSSPASYARAERSAACHARVGTQDEASDGGEAQTYPAEPQARAAGKMRVRYCGHAHRAGINAHARDGRQIRLGPRGITRPYRRRACSRFDWWGPVSQS